MLSAALFLPIFRQAKLDGGQRAEGAGVAASEGSEVLAAVLKALDAVTDSAVALPRTKIKTESKVMTRGTRTQPYRTADGTWVRPLLTRKSLT